jgi:hypothetical protein
MELAILFVQRTRRKEGGCLDLVCVIQLRNLMNMVMKLSIACFLDLVHRPVRWNLGNQKLTLIRTPSNPKLLAVHTQNLQIWSNYFTSLRWKWLLYETWHHVLMDLPLQAVKDVTRLPLAQSPVCSRTSAGSGCCLRIKVPIHLLSK